MPWNRESPPIPLEMLLEPTIVFRGFPKTAELRDELRQCDQLLRFAAFGARRENPRVTPHAAPNHETVHAKVLSVFFALFPALDIIPFLNTF